jgi:hypothetical protein
MNIATILTLRCGPMDINEIYEEILPYLADPKSLNEFLEKHKDKSVDQLITELENINSETDPAHQTDLRILLNTLYKHKKKN